MASKQALIITAYCEIGYLKELLKIYNQYFKCYIHIDKKCKVSESDFWGLNSLQDVTVIQKYKINWGSYKHIQAIVDLLKMAANDGCTYFHIISANTIPIKHPSKILDFFEGNDNIYMEIQERHELSKKDKLLSFKTFELKNQVFYFQHIYNLKGGPDFWRKLNIVPKMETAFALLQYKIGIRRKIIYNYKGYVYCHFPLDAAIYLIDYINSHPEYLKNLKYCYVGEEYFFQNIFMNSKFKNRVVCDTKIYDIWNPERGNPAFLLEKDLIDIQNSEAFFARKVGDNNKMVLDKIRDKEAF